MDLQGAAGQISLAEAAVHSLCVQLTAELSELSRHFRNFASEKETLNDPSDFGFLDECLLEGLLSRTWQVWCGFCRSCFMHSCMGTVTSRGSPVDRLPEAISESHVSGAAIRAKRQSAPPFWVEPNTLLRKEPTWGDVDTLVVVISRIKPNNYDQLLATFSTVHKSAKAIQNIRNCSAHNNAQTMSGVMDMMSSFIVFPIAHPTHAMFWLDPHSSDFLITHAIDDLIESTAEAL